MASRQVNLHFLEDFSLNDAFASMAGTGEKVLQRVLVIEIAVVSGFRENKGFASRPT